MIVNPCFGVFPGPRATIWCGLLWVPKLLSLISTMLMFWYNDVVGRLRLPSTLRSMKILGMGADEKMFIRSHEVFCAPPMRSSSSSSSLKSRGYQQFGPQNVRKTGSAIGTKIVH